MKDKGYYYITDEQDTDWTEVWLKGNPDRTESLETFRNRVLARLRKLINIKKQQERK